MQSIMYSGVFVLFSNIVIYNIVCPFYAKKLYKKKDKILDRYVHNSVKKEFPDKLIFKIPDYGMVLFIFIFILGVIFGFATE